MSRSSLYIFASFLVASLVSLGTLFTHISASLPKDVAAELRERVQAMSQASVVLDRHDKVVGMFSDATRLPMALSAVPEHVQQAFLAAEDARFYLHSGVSLVGSLRSLLVNLRKQGMAQGGSTITQQLVRQFLLTREKRMGRKLSEIILAVRLEQNMTKDEIFETWLNSIYLGNNAWGIEAGAQHYFRKSARDLTIAEAAMLAGLPKAPAKYAPHQHPAAARQRKLYVLKQMYANGWLTKKDYHHLATTSVTVWKDRTAIEYQAPWVMEATRLELWRRFEQQKLPRTGLRVKTTVDMAWQRKAQDLMEQRLSRWKLSGLEAGFIVVDRLSGETRTLIGGLDFEHNAFNRATSLSRPFGPSLNPLVYGWASDDGVISIPGQISLGASAIATKFGEADQIASILGYGNVREKLRQFGFRLSDTAGIDEVQGSPAALAHGWRMLSSGASNVKPTLTTEISTATNERLLINPTPVPGTTVSPSASFLVQSWLHDAGYAGMGAESVRFRATSGWNYWEVAVSKDVIAALWLGADAKPPHDPAGFHAMQQDGTQFVSSWLTATDNNHAVPNSGAPAGISWHLLTGKHKDPVRVPFPTSLQ